ncbi:amino acid ABC transporter permease [Cereibacter changlensis JA139]|uniref:Amino acid ABC transporter permease n=2 Tax=Cereibacter changlensis TaxID=402884 RepID=A0A2T4JTY1_9RHOB|nr:amino acid ABC transporter permease [Cereibacter changlensis]PTE21381.1 amino acid ABC transporter permease [Cereibacter changlensis JA139]PZX58590.1 L-glutamine ABC transporter membrane protein /L-glutamate ABC transporter membrane protein /L-aspartate ABC transporter membrane protein /L-asparagine ABC transporter membrane protein [Cereibacter changlensis]
MSDTHAQTVPFVRDTMLPQANPPTTEAGAVRWMRENLLSGPLNVILTLLAIAAIYWVVQGMLPWLLASVWNAGSIAECRQIIADAGRESGACWAVIRERWPQFLFGFYPNHLYWRPVTALLLLFVALAPVLFSKAPRQLLWFSAIYPGLAFWLLWGGSVFVPVVALLGLALGWAAFHFGQRISPLAGVVAAILLPVLWWLFLAGPVAEDLGNLLPRSMPWWMEEVRSDKFGGFVLALTIGVSGIALSLPLGIVLALGRQSDMFLIKSLSVCFIEFIRGVPLITLLFTASLLLNYFLPPGTTFDIILRVIIMVTLFAAAYIAEVIRGGLAALPRGQYEAADALGLDYFRAQRLIILPQALKISIPGIVSTFIGMFKDTTLVVFVGLLDPLKGITDAVRASPDWKGIYWEPYIFVGAIFFIFNFSMSRYSMYLERKLKTDHR